MGLNSILRANNSGCLDACENSVYVVVYQEQVRFGGVALYDVDEIIQELIVKNKPVERMKIKDEKFNR